MNKKFHLRNKKWLIRGFIFLFILTVVISNTQTKSIVAQKNTYNALADSNRVVKAKFDKCMQANVQVRDTCFFELEEYLEARVLEFERLASEM